jgi:NAD(P)-dependent dehydrogenase (short-subunit alcohol dehydrogenase family)
MVEKITHSGARLQGRKIVITGAASGIGFSTAELFVSHGASVALLDRDRGIEDIAKRLGGFGACVDITNESDVAQAIVDAAKALNGLDGLVNCAGVSSPSSLANTEPSSWRQVLEINLTGAFLVTRAALSHLQKAPSATIVNVASGLALKPEPQHGAYVASKAGLLGWTKVIAQELGPSIRVNALCPGITETDMIRPIIKAGVTLGALGEGRALKRTAQPIEQAYGILYLTSDESAFVTGSTLSVDGGRSYY